MVWCLETQKQLSADPKSAFKIGEMPQRLTVDGVAPHLKSAGPKTKPLADLRPNLELIRGNLRR